ncbi:hypothetical protein OESDEN_06479 [Oesophagostomum dentatum]|uniref:Uncharacterized protein n=1 Tax=Oesophagostomum dentatum TaxID=61180 RepID=A0A0B1TCR2_OESDE|nr:hypothetical protein OESDEN_06479 [Oesophagostomum dentatum]
MKFLNILVIVALTMGTARAAAMASRMTFKKLCDGMCPAAFNPEDPKLNIQGPGKIELQAMLFRILKEEWNHGGIFV